MLVGAFHITGSSLIRSPLTRPTFNRYYGAHTCQREWPVLRRCLSRFWPITFVVLLLCTHLPQMVAGQSAAVDEPNTANLLLPPNDRFGLNRASFGAEARSGYRQELGAEAGALWNRWPLYWYLVESDKGIDYTAYDRAVAGDLLRGTNLDIVLMGTPPSYASSGLVDVPPPLVGEKRTEGDYGWREGSEASAASQGSSPTNLTLPIFSDGTDNYAPGKAVNRENYWARFVNLTVKRYKPDGELANRGIVPKGVGVRHWEIWNEPDVPFYWNGRGPKSEVQDYMRLLKVAYLAAKAADSQAVIVVGGMSYWGREGFVAELLDAILADPQSGGNGYYFDVVAWHVYSRPVDLYNRVSWTRRLLADRRIGGKQVWVNETNIPVWGDPSPATKARATHRATPDEQAAFILQAYAYAFAAGADKVFTFMLYDDCWQEGEHYGLVRNPPGNYNIADCAGDGQPRPGYAAYKTASAYLRGIRSARLYSAGPQGQADVASFDTESGRRVVVAWNRTDFPLTIDIPLSRRALLVDQNGATTVVTPNPQGAYSLYLPPATNDDAYEGEPPTYIVGGRTYMLVDLVDQAPSGLLLNGGFEMRPAFAAWFSDGSGTVLNPLTRGGERSVMLKVAPSQEGLASVTQTVVVPERTRPILSFSYAIHTAQPLLASGAVASRFELTVLTAGKAERVLLSEVTAFNWRERSFDLSEYAGQVVTLAFRVKGQEYPMAAYVDNVSLSIYRNYLPLVPNAPTRP